MPARHTQRPYKSPVSGPEKDRRPDPVGTRDHPDPVGTRDHARGSSLAARMQPAAPVAVLQLLPAPVRPSPAYLLPLSHRLLPRMLLPAFPMSSLPHHRSIFTVPTPAPFPCTLPSHSRRICSSSRRCLCQSNKGMQRLRRGQHRNRPIVWKGLEMWSWMW